MRCKTGMLGANKPRGWDISSLSFIRSLSVTDKESAPNSLFFRDNGLAMYVGGNVSDKVHEYTLSSAWNISTATFAQSLSVGDITGLFFAPDGTSMFAVDAAFDTLKKYLLSQAWNISTATYDSDLSIATQEGTPTGVFLGDAGTKLFVVGISASFNLSKVHQYSLSSAWDITTASYQHSLTVNNEDGEARGMFFKSDGKTLFVSGRENDNVYEYVLSSAWDVSTASYVRSASVASDALSAGAIYVRDDGNRLYVIGFANDSVCEYAVA